MSFTAPGGSAPVPSVSIADASVVEGNQGTTNLFFVVSLSSASSNTITVNFATNDSSATAGQDYDATTGVLTFAPGTTNQTISVVVHGDTQVESDESLTVTLSNPAGATLAKAQATGVIVNDDAAPLDHPMAMSLARSTGATTIEFASVAGLNYGLRFTNSFGLTAPLSTWPVATSRVPGTGAVLSLADPSTDTDRFYVIEVSR